MTQIYGKICNGVSLLSALAVLTACSNEPTPPPAPKQQTENRFEKGVAGGSTMTTLEVHARIVAVDRDNRRITLMGSDGEPFDVSVDAGTTDLSHLEKGDLVKITLSRRLDVTVTPGDRLPQRPPAAFFMLSASAQKPGAALSDMKALEARVVAIDRTKRTATLEMPDGKRETFPVRPDVDLSRYRAGDRVDLLLTHAIKVELIKPARP